MFLEYVIRNEKKSGTSLTLTLREIRWLRNGSLSFHVFTVCSSTTRVISGEQQQEVPGNIYQWFGYTESRQDGEPWGGR